MGILGKFFGKKESKQKVAEATKQSVVAKNVVNSTIAQNNTSSEVGVATLSYGYHTIPVEAFREGLKKGATIKAFCDKSGSFIPLSQLGDTLLLSDPTTNTTIPLINYEGLMYQDIYEYVFGKRYNNDDEEDYNDYEEEEWYEA